MKVICIDTKGLAPQAPLRLGATYTAIGDISCHCPYHWYVIQELRLPAFIQGIGEIKGLVRVCRRCQIPVDPREYMVFFKWRFIPAPPLDESFIREVEALYRSPKVVPVKFGEIARYLPNKGGKRG